MKKMFLFNQKPPQTFNKFVSIPIFVISLGTGFCLFIWTNYQVINFAKYHPESINGAILAIWPLIARGTAFLVCWATAMILFFVFLNIYILLGGKPDSEKPKDDTPFHSGKELRRKKVYGPIGLVYVTGLLISGSIVWAFLCPRNQIAAPLFIGMAFLIYFIRAIFLCSIPTWAYDENGFELLFGIVDEGKYKWAEVDKIAWKNNLQGNGGKYFFSTKNGASIDLSPSVTREYTKVLSDVVRYVQKNNPSATIDPAILRGDYSRF